MDRTRSTIFQVTDYNTVWEQDDSIISNRMIPMPPSILLDCYRCAQIKWSSLAMKFVSSSAAVVVLSVAAGAAAVQHPSCKISNET
eukprot:scaffold2468_cov189-Chaetoceros_neogracile.AAC.2